MLWKCQSRESVSHLLINYYVQPDIYVHISTPSVLFCVRMGSMNGFFVDYSKYLSYFHVIDQSGNALQSNQSEEVFNVLKRLPIDLQHRFQK